MSKIGPLEPKPTDHGPAFTHKLRELCDWADTLLCNAIPSTDAGAPWLESMKRWRDDWHSLKHIPAPPVLVSEATHVHPPAPLVVGGPPGSFVPLPPDTEQTLKFDAHGGWRYVPTVNRTPSVTMFPTLIEFTPDGAMRCSQYQSLKGVTSMKLCQGTYDNQSFRVDYDDGSHTLLEVRPGMKVQMYPSPTVNRCMPRVS